VKLPVPEAKTLVFGMNISIRWGDMDAMGHVNNAVYFRYLETVRLQWLHQVCGGSLDTQGEGALIVNAFCNFIKQLEFPGDVRALLYVANPGRSSFDTFVILERADAPGVVYASGGATAVWVDFKRQQSLPMPDWFRARLERGTVVDNSPHPDNAN
jgi:acyl-CoA thioester hydrolase